MARRQPGTGPAAEEFWLAAGLLVGPCLAWLKMLASCHGSPQRQRVHAVSMPREMQATGPVPNAIHFDAAVSACGRGAQRRGPPLRLVALGAAVSARPRAQLRERALCVLRAAGPIALHARSRRAEHRGQRVRGVCAERERALLLVGGLPRQRLDADAVTCSAAIGACEKGQRWEMALASWEAMLRQRVRANEALPARCASLRAAAGALELAHLWQRTLAVLGCLQRGRQRPDVATSRAALGALEAAGHAQQALPPLAAAADAVAWRECWSRQDRRARRREAARVPPRRSARLHDATLEGRPGLGSELTRESLQAPGRRGGARGAQALLCALGHLGGAPAAGALVAHAARFELLLRAPFVLSGSAVGIGGVPAVRGDVCWRRPG
ncbi:unnamed protein product [Prorocentrum cordatum]|uniref:Uncharacterized protein n=1 Tax=Prorocentrum cordatum TaxID=2364126 RepID=A0ABN9Y2H1_9DINO|nr:unnamed protein product [Polarella glacialis]